MVDSEEKADGLIGSRAGIRFVRDAAFILQVGLTSPNYVAVICRLGARFDGTIPQETA
jgi:hypothetical protein